MARFVYPQHRATKVASSRDPLLGTCPIHHLHAGLFGSVALLLIALLMHI